ncbi:MAG: hypothetical protein ACRDRH_27370 [Pseudonocardia sp.]
MNESPYIEVFQMAIGVYDNHDELAVDSELARVADLLADFGGEITRPWDISMRERGDDAVGARLGAWSRAVGGPTVLHGWATAGRTARTPP